MSKYKFYLDWDQLINDVSKGTYADAGALELIENGTLIIACATMTFNNLTDTLIFTGLRIGSPVTGALITVPDNSVVVPAGSAIVLKEMTYPLKSATRDLDIVDLNAAAGRDVRNVYLGVHPEGSTNLLFRPDKVY